MGQTLEMLLAADPAKIKDVPTGQLEIKRLSRQLGQPFIVKFQAATVDQIKEIGEKATINGEPDEAEEMKWTIYEMTIDPDFKNEELRKTYGIARPVDIVTTILLGGEVITLYNAILKLSGLDKTGFDLDEIKN
jgi:hypothetical protein